MKIAFYAPGLEQELHIPDAQHPGLWSVQLRLSDRQGPAASIDLDIKEGRVHLHSASTNADGVVRHDPGLNDERPGLTAAMDEARAVLSKGLEQDNMVLRRCLHRLLAALDGR